MPWAVSLPWKPLECPLQRSQPKQASEHQTHKTTIKRITANQNPYISFLFTVDIFCDFVIMISHDKQILNMIAQKGTHGN